MTGSSSLLRSAGLVGFFTLVSRITGMFLSMVLGRTLGLGLASDAFFVAYRLPNLLRRFAAEGTMTGAFLPTISEVEAKDGDAAAKAMVANFLGTLGLLIGGLCAVAIVAMGVVVGLQVLGRIAPGETPGQQIIALGHVLAGRRPAPADFLLTTALARIMFPYLLLVSLTAGLSAVLNLKGRFGLPASVSTFSNLTVISVVLGAILLGPASWREPATATFVCAVGVMAGGIVQLAVLWPSFHGLGYRIRWGLHFADDGVRRILKRMLPGLLGTGIHPINVLVSTAIASQLPNGAQTVLFQSNLMGELVLGLFSASLATVSLPAMSRQADAGDLDGLRGNLGSALRATALLALPASVGLAVLAKPIIALIFQGGRFDAAAVDWTAATLPYQALGLLFVATSRIAVQAHYALKNYHSPAKGALLGFCVNIPLSWVLMKAMGTNGIALANGLASLTGLLYVTGALHRRLGRLPYRPVLSGWVEFGATSALMGLVAWGGGLWLGAYVFRSTTDMFLRLVPLIALSTVFYFAVLRMAGNPETKNLLGALRRRLG